MISIKYEEKEKKYKVWREKEEIQKIWREKEEIKKSVQDAASKDGERHIDNWDGDRHFDDDVIMDINLKILCTLNWVAWSLPLSWY